MYRPISEIKFPPAHCAVADTPRMPPLSGEARPQRTRKGTGTTQSRDRAEHSANPGNAVSGAQALATLANRALGLASQLAATAPTSWSAWSCGGVRWGWGRGENRHST
jgi:hypothetical protein